MIIKAYGIELHRLREDDIELIRRMRNADHVKRYMEFRNYISPNQQKIWFKSINNVNNLFYLIVVNGLKVGLINAANVDWDKGVTHSGGIFIWDEKYLGTYVPLNASLLLTDTSIALGFTESKAKILKTNNRAILYNKMFGYEILPNQGDVENQEYVLHSNLYIEKTKNIRKLVHQKYGAKIELIIDDPDNFVTKFILDKINNAKGIFRENFIFTYL